jgi:hypothetical protein
LKWDLSQVATGVIAFAMFVLTLQAIGAMFGGPVAGEIVGGMVTLILGALGAEGYRHGRNGDDGRGCDPDGSPRDSSRPQYRRDENSRFAVAG